MNKAVASNPDAKWKVVIFHSDIYGSDSHMQIQMLAITELYLHH
ncbi:MAG: hypothetical protein ACLR7D_03180 [Lachnospira eligens]